MRCYLIGTVISKKRTGASAKCGLAPAQFRSMSSPHQPGRTERFTFRPIIISLHVALLFLNLNEKACFTISLVAIKYSVWIFS
jgi:hypothetical protein